MLDYLSKSDDEALRDMVFYAFSKMAAIGAFG
jgi:hypothetical protein